MMKNDGKAAFRGGDPMIIDMTLLQGEGLEQYRGYGIYLAVHSTSITVQPWLFAPYPYGGATSGYIRNWRMIL